MIRKLYLRLMCLVGKHRYFPTCSVRTWRARRGNHYLRQEVQYKCACCGKPTQWMRLSKAQEFEESLGKRFGWRIML